MAAEPHPSIREKIWDARKSTRLVTVILGGIFCSVLTRIDAKTLLCDERSHILTYQAVGSADRYCVKVARTHKIVQKPSTGLFKMQVLCDESTGGSGCCLCFDSFLQCQARFSTDGRRALVKRPGLPTHVRRISRISLRMITTVVISALRAGGRASGSIKVAVRVDRSHFATVSTIACAESFERSGILNRPNRPNFST